MRLISPGGENLLDYLELWQVLSTSDGDLRDPLWWPQERPVPMRIARWPLGIPLPSMPGPKSLCGSVLEPEDSSPVLKWILGFFGSLPRGVSPHSSGGIEERFPPELYQQCRSSRRVDQGTSGFPSRLSHEAFSRGFLTGLSHVPPCCESILGLKVEAVQGKLVSLELTEISGVLWEWWHDTGVPLTFPVERASS